MKSFKINNKGSGKLFANKYLESLTRTHFLFPVLLYYLGAITGIVYVLAFSFVSILQVFWIFPVGMVFFTLIEYLIHRFVFHFRVNSAKEEKIQYNIHGIHHEFPRDKDRLVMPPVLSIILAFVFFIAFYVFFSHPGIVLFSGLCAGYSTYLVIHYSVHALKPPHNFLKYLWTHHSLHHYHSVKVAFSVSLPFWDYLFGTMPEKKKD